MTALHTLELTAQLDLAAIQATQPDRYPGLLRTTGIDSGWDILFGFPQQIDRFTLADGLARLREHPAMQLSVRTSDAQTTPLPFRGGWLACLSYELGGLLEPAVQRTEDGGQRTEKREAGGLPRSNFPVAWFARIPLAILQQPASGRCVLVVEHDYLHLRDDALRDLHHQTLPIPVIPPDALIREEDPEQFLRGVERIQAYIRAGDVFQVNLSRAWRVQFAARLNPAALFAALMRSNPAPFSALLQFDDYAVVSSSPERLVNVDRNARITTRPIAGTYPRGLTPAEDAALSAQLAQNPKERAEHVMLVDLERNDLGRVCVPGSVRVEALMDVTHYQYVHHIESTIVGRLREGVRVFDVLRAVFPGGTITGCPKVRTMQIINALEPSPREAYTGSVGYINLDGSLDFNILIRSFQVQGAQLTFRAGAGIVSDSQPARELAETRTKARGLLRALGVT
ncbi:MAG: aminodeoxychorismate synthase component I [Thiobacillus sp.]